MDNPSAVTPDSPRTHHVFLSYSRKDNQPDHQGWVAAFHERLRDEHNNWSHTTLDVFFDRSHIRDMDDWRQRIEQHLRRSIVFIAFLSPNYRDSPNCQWELEAYLEREHALVHGHDGIAQVYFVDVPELEAPPQGGAPHELPKWMRALQSRHSEKFDLRPWFHEGPAALRELEVRERLEDLLERGDPRALLLDRIQALDQRIMERVERAALAESAPGNLPPRGLATWVGRRRELSALQSALSTDRVGLVSAVHGLGGLGKTALALQYASSFGDHYATGGRWLVPCERMHSIEEAFLELARVHEPPIEVPRELQADPQRAAAYILKMVHKTALKRAQELSARDRESGRETLHEAHALVILDNIADPAMLKAESLQSIPASDWLHVLVTTRLDATTLDVKAVPIDGLSDDDSLELLRLLQVNGRFAMPEDDAAAKEIAHLLGGFTLAVEAAGAYLRINRDYITARQYLDALRNDGLATLEQSADEAADVIRHREKQLELVLRPALAKLEPEALTALSYASLMAPDFVVVEWLRKLTAGEHPHLLEGNGLADPWRRVLQRLEGLRLLTRAEEERKSGLPRVMRIHRLVALQVQSTIEKSSNLRIKALASVVEEAAHQLQEDIHHEFGASSSVPALISNTAALPGEWRLKTATTVLPICARVEIAHGDLNAALNWAVQGVEDAHQLVKANPNSGEAWQKRMLALEALASCLLTRSRSGDAQRAAELLVECVAIGRAQVEANPASDVANYNLSSSLGTFAEWLLQRGKQNDLGDALELLVEREHVCRKLLKKNSDSDKAQRNLSLAQVSLAACLLQRGRSEDAERALVLFRDSVLQRRKLLTANPESEQARFDLSAALRRLADCLLEHGQPHEAKRALELLEDSERLCRSLQETNPSSAQARYGLAMSVKSLAWCLLQHGQPVHMKRALEFVEESEILCRELLEQNPDSADARQKLIAPLAVPASWLLRRGQAGDVECALKPLEDVKRLSRELLEADPDSRKGKRRLATVLGVLAGCMLQRGQPGDATYARALLKDNKRLRRELLEADPNSSETKRDLSVALERLADCLLEHGQPRDARTATALFKECVALRRSLCDIAPKSPASWVDLAWDLRNLGIAWTKRSDKGKELAVASVVEQLVDIAERFDRNSWLVPPWFEQLVKPFRGDSPA